MKKIYKEILTLALPVMFENILQMFMGTVDSYLVASLGIAALSGVSVANQFLALYQSVFVALVAVISAQLSQALSQENQERVHHVIGEGVTFTLLVGLLLGSLSLLAGPHLLKIMGAEVAVSQAGGLYLACVGGTIVLLGLLSSLGAILRTIGKPRVPMYVSLFVNILNIMLSAFAVFVLDTGVVGVAIGTIVSRLLGCLFLWLQVPTSFRKWQWSCNRTFLLLILPAAGERFMMRGGDMVVLTFIIGLGTSVVAGNAIGETLTQFNYMPALGVATAVVILTAKYHTNEEKIKQVYKAGLSIAVVVMYIVALLVYLLGPWLIGLYTKDAEVSISSWLVLAYSILGVPFTASTLIFTALWQGLGNTKFPFYVTSLGMWLIRILGAYILITVFHFGFHAIWIGTILDNVFRSTFLYYYYKMRRRNQCWNS